MGWVRWAIIVLALAPGVWMTFDGTRALVVGDYVTPRSGPHAGRLGPWRHPVEALGIDPRGTPMKLVFVAMGLLWLAAAAACALGVRHAEAGVLVLGVATLWYLPIGTFVATLEVVLTALRIRGRSVQG
jgi:hypothetical protein